MIALFLCLPTCTRLTKHPLRDHCDPSAQPKLLRQHNLAFLKARPRRYCLVSLTLTSPLLLSLVLVVWFCLSIVYFKFLLQKNCVRTQVPALYSHYCFYDHYLMRIVLMICELWIYFWIAKIAVTDCFYFPCKVVVFLFHINCLHQRKLPRESSGGATASWNFRQLCVSFKYLANVFHLGGRPWFSIWCHCLIFLICTF